MSLSRFQLFVREWHQENPGNGGPNGMRKVAAAWKAYKGTCGKTMYMGNGKASDKRQTSFKKRVAPRKPTTEIPEQLLRDPAFREWVATLAYRIHGTVLSELTSMKRKARIRKFYKLHRKTLGDLDQLAAIARNAVLNTSGTENRVNRAKENLRVVSRWLAVAPTKAMMADVETLVHKWESGRGMSGLPNGETDWEYQQYMRSVQEGKSSYGARVVEAVLRHPERYLKLRDSRL